MNKITKIWDILNNIQLPDNWKCEFHDNNILFFYNNELSMMVHNFYEKNLIRLTNSFNGKEITHFFDISNIDDFTVYLFEVINKFEEIRKLENNLLNSIIEFNNNFKMENFNNFIRNYKLMKII